MNEKDNLITALMNRYELDEGSAKRVITYAKSLSAAKDDKSNDYAIAKALNERITNIIRRIAIAYQFHSFEATDIDIRTLNKSFVLLVNEVKKIYDQNKELSDISISPVWEYFDILEDNEGQINEYVFDNQNDEGQQHNAQVNKLCIIAGVETPSITPELEQIISDSDKAIDEYNTLLKDLTKKEKKWFIPNYSLKYEIDGTIIVNEVYKLKKVHAGSAPEKLMEQATSQPNVMFKPNLGQTARNLSTTISSMGFDKTLRKLFFSVVSNDKGIIFRPTVSRATADAERINTSDLDLLLKQHNANIEYESSIPF